MNWIQILELVIVLLPMLLKLLKGMEDKQEAEKIADEVTTVAGNILIGTTPVNNPVDVMTAMIKPLMAA